MRERPGFRVLIDSEPVEEEMDSHRERLNPLKRNSSTQQRSARPNLQLRFISGGDPCVRVP